MKSEFALREFVRKVIQENQSYTTVYSDVASRVNPALLKKYMAENNWEDGDEESAVEYFMEDEYSLSVDSDGLISFYTLTPEVEKLIGGNMVKLYHFTSEKFEKNIKKQGLVTGLKKTNPYKNSYSGIYLTTVTSGPVIDGYKHHIRQKWAGGVILVVVKLYLSEIRPDMDDFDIGSGKTQFVSENVPPDRIVSIEGTY